MRVDVFLKQSRLIKRRSLAKELCDEGAVLLNGRPVRAGRDVAAGDELTLNLRNRRISVEIAEIPERPPGAKHARELYRILHDERLAEDRDD